MIERSFGAALFRFRVLGIPVRVEVTFVLVALLLAGTRRLAPKALVAWLVVVFFSILIHELAHALVGRWLGRTPDVRLYAWGGLTSWSDGDGKISHGEPRRSAPDRESSDGERKGSAPDRKRHAHDLAIALAGPAVAIAIGQACLLAKGSVPEHEVWLLGVLEDLVWANRYWGLINLLPVLPLDGGVAAGALLGMVRPELREYGSRAVSMVAAMGAIGFALHHEQWVLAGCAAWLAIENGRQLGEVAMQARDAELVAKLGPIFDAALKERDGEALAAAAEGALGERRSDATQRWLAEMLAIGRAMSGAIDGAVDALAMAPRKSPANAAIEAFVVSVAVMQYRRDMISQLSPAGVAPPEPRSDAAREGRHARTAAAPDDVDTTPWLDAVSSLHGVDVEKLDAVQFARIREAAAILRRDGIAARIGEVLLERRPDPDLALSVGWSWRRAGNARRARRLAARAVELGCRDETQIASLAK